MASTRSSISFLKILLCGKTTKTTTTGRCWVVTTERGVFTCSSDFLIQMFQSDKLSDADMTSLAIQHTRAGFDVAHA